MNLKRVPFILLLGFSIPFALSWVRVANPVQASQPTRNILQGRAYILDEKIHVVLHRVDNVKPDVFSGFTFDKDAVAEALKKYPVKLPNPLPAGAELGYMSGPCYALKQHLPGESKIKLTIDVNANFDLTDDLVMELPDVDSIEKGTIIKIARVFGGASPHTEWLPYLVFYHQIKRRDGQVLDSVNIGSYYCYQGDFRLGMGGHEYTLLLSDGDARGRFIREKLVNVYLNIRPIGQEEWSQGHRFFELIPLEDALYEVKDFAEDGSWIDLQKSSLPTTALGKPAPDMRMIDTAGTKFRISDYEGKLLLLDFWYAGCKPCIAKFPDIKKAIEWFASKPFASIGINIDEAARVEQAKKVIADYQLTWRQVVEGKGEFIPVYQVYGRLPERPMIFPIYVAIDENGVAKYSTNDFLKMKRFLDAHFNDPKGPGNTLFVPCSGKYGPASAPRPTIKADFSSRNVQDLVKSGKLKMPDGLPRDARVGLLPNGTALIAYAGSAPGKLRLMVDVGHDFDMTKAQGYDIPILTGPSPDVSKMVEISIQVPWASGGIAFLGMPAYARPVSAGGLPEVYALGRVMSFEGTFFLGKRQYALEIADLNGDGLLTEEDTSAPGFLKLKMKKGDSWVVVHEGTTHIPIGGSLYRLKFVSDDGFLVELEKEK